MKEFDKAIDELFWAENNSSDESLKQVAIIRRLKLLIEVGKTEQALTTVEPIIKENLELSANESVVSTNTFIPVYNEIYGDILVLQDKKDEAKKAYDRALAGMILAGVSTELLRIKRNDLGE